MDTLGEASEKGQNEIIDVESPFIHSFYHHPLVSNQNKEMCIKRRTAQAINKDNRQS